MVFAVAFVSKELIDFFLLFVASGNVAANPVQGEEAVQDIADEEEEEEEDDEDDVSIFRF
jgi:hypothetical protein